ncbi:MAG: hypothetical protein ACHQNV_00740 [Vicinamibacteria bacterium]
MEAPPNLETVLLQALFSGPADRIALIERVTEGARGKAGLTPRRLSQTLKDLEAAGLVRHWSVRPAEGRTRDTSVYYELTVKGVTAAGVLRDLLAGLRAAGGRPGRRRAEGSMEARLKRSLEISALAQDLRRGSRKLRA